MRQLLAAPLVLLAFGCSIVDPGDRAELRDRLGIIPPSEMADMVKMAMRAAAFKFLHGKDDADKMGTLLCRYQAGGQWTNWTEQEPPYIVYDMLDCLRKNPFEMTYLLCWEEWASVQTQLRKTDLMNTHPVPGGSNVECKFVWDSRYEPEKVPVKVTDPDAITADDLIDALIELPVPPPGWAFPELVPLLCPLGAGPGWGCPPKPDDTTAGQPSAPPGGQPGDHP